MYKLSRKTERIQDRIVRYELNTCSFKGISGISIGVRNVHVYKAVVTADVHITEDERIEIYRNCRYPVAIFKEEGIL